MTFIYSVNICFLEYCVCVGCVCGVCVWGVRVGVCGCVCGVCVWGVRVGVCGCVRGDACVSVGGCLYVRGCGACVWLSSMSSIL